MNIKKKKITERLYLWILQARKIKSKKKKKTKAMINYPIFIVSIDF